jgi:hypothetical protein
VTSFKTSKTKMYAPRHVGDLNYGNKPHYVYIHVPIVHFESHRLSDGANFE